MVQVYLPGEYVLKVVGEPSAKTAARSEIGQSCCVAAVKECDVVVLGNGAARLMCAITAGNRGRRILFLDSANKIGKKILISGGGRCNFTNVNTEPSRFLSLNPAFCISALSRYTPWDFIAVVEKHGIAYHEKTLGQLFCNDSSKQILQMLVDECDKAGITILTHCQISSANDAERFVINSNKGDFSSQTLVIATGGLSIPKMGASDLGYRLARQFGLNVIDTRAGLVPFTCTGEVHEMLQRLSGVSAPACFSGLGHRDMPRVSLFRILATLLECFPGSLTVSLRGEMGEDRLDHYRVFDAGDDPDRPAAGRLPP